MKNTLIQYKGGGYDGCIWEYNYCYYDEKGNWHDIAHSGYAGCESETAWLDYKDNNKIDDDYFLLSLNQAGIGALALNVPYDHVLGVALKLQSDGYEIGIPCSNCGNLETDLDTLELSDIRGCGGTAMCADSILCENCQITLEEEGTV